VIRSAPQRAAAWSWPLFWRRVERAPHRFLALDYDGTLAPFRVNRLQARPADGALPLLAEIAALPGVGLAVLSGRPVSELTILLGDPGAVFSGNHGWEIRFADGRTQTFAPTEKQRKILVAAAARLRGHGLGKFVEEKAASVAFHTRAFSGTDAKRLDVEARAIVAPLLDGAPLAWRPFDGGVELRCPDRNKGTAFGELLACQPLGAFPVYVGDDDTDEDVFRALGDRGVGVKVGGAISASAAPLRLADCAAVVGFLREWRNRLAETS
jgi:trehalose-phosphatase